MKAVLGDEFAQLTERAAESMKVGELGALASVILALRGSGAPKHNATAMLLTDVLAARVELDLLHREVDVTPNPERK